MHIWRGNAFAEVHGAPPWFLEYAARHLSVPVPMGTGPSERFGSIWWYQDEPYGSLVHREGSSARVSAGLGRYIASLAKYYRLPCEVHDMRVRPDDRVPWWSLQVKWRPYQDDVFKACMAGEAGIIDAPPRSGKTIMAARVIDALAVPTLYVAPTVAIVKQTYDLFVRHFGTDLCARLDGEATRAEKDISKAIVVATAASAVGQDIEWFKTREMLVVDEFHHCLVSSTNVLTDTGPRAISVLKRGDWVWSAGPSGLLELRSVVRVWERPAPATVLRIRTTIGMLEVTSEHQIFTPDGKVKAGSLREGSCVRVLQMRKDDCAEGTCCSSRARVQETEETEDALDVPQMHEDGASAIEGRAYYRMLWEEWFRHDALAQESDAEALQEQSVPQASVGTDEEEEPRAQPGVARSDDCRLQEGDCGRSGDTVRTRDGRQGSWADQIRTPSGTGFETVGFRSRACCVDWSDEGRGQCHLVLPRLGTSGEEDRSGDRRLISPEPQGSRRSEGCLALGEQLGSDSDTSKADRAGLAVVTGRVLEIETIAPPCSTVYDLEVEGNHNYFAEGVLVSNSAAKTYHTISAKADNAYYRFMFTGTHFRTGDDALAMEAVCSQVLHRIRVQDLVPDYLAPPRVCFAPVHAPPLQYVQDWREAYEQGIVWHKQRNDLIVRLAEKLALDNDIPTMILVRRRAHADYLGERIAESVVVKGGQNALTSRSVKEFIDGRHQVLIGTTVLGEGVDVPRAAALIYASAGAEGVTMMQSYFRPLTAHPGKTIGRIYDFQDRHHRTLREHARKRMEFAQRQLGRCVFAP